MKLEFAVGGHGAVTEITLNLRTSHGQSTPHDLAAMSDSVKEALTPHLEELAQRNSQAGLEELKARALNEKLSFAERRRAAAKFEELTGEGLVLLNAPSFASDLREIGRNQSRFTAGSDSADLAGVNKHVGQPDSLTTEEHHDIAGVPDGLLGNTHGDEPSQVTVPLRD